MNYELLTLNPSQFKASIFLAFLGIMILSAGLLFVLSLRAQKKYNNDVLPDIPGMSNDGEDLVFSSLNHSDDDQVSAFEIDDEDEKDKNDDSSGDKESEDLLRATRSAQRQKERKSFFKKDKKS